VGTQESMMQAIRATRPGGHIGYVGVAHDVQLPGDELFFSHVHLHAVPPRCVASFPSSST
jgi:threonine dehydrogenase-like Zn-dependent dehydrogenase